MEHAEAVKLNAVERYLLGELTDTERDGFEAHFFECRACAAEVRVAAAFIENAREVMRRTPHRQTVVSHEGEKRSARFGWLQPGYALAMLVVLALALGYQSFVAIPRIKRSSLSAVAQPLPTLSLTTSGSRGGAGIPEITVARRDPFGIFVDIPVEGSFTAYSCAILSSDGKDMFDIHLSPEQVKDTVQLFIPGEALRPGTYNLVIFGHSTGQRIPASEIGRYPFVLKNAQ